MHDSSNGSARTSEFEHHRGLLFAIAYCMLGSVADAEDGRIRAIFIVTDPEKLSHLPPPPC